MANITFPEDEENISIFPLEDLVKEYNYKISQPFVKERKAPLSLSVSHVNSDRAIIKPITEQELQQIRFKLQASDWNVLQRIVSGQFSMTGLVSNVPSIAAGVTVLELLQEFGLKGKVYYKTVGEKVYVILKGNPGDRTMLTGTRYLNTHPEIVRFGLAKVSIKDAAKLGFKGNVLIYGGVKTLTGLKMILEDGSLSASFFGSMAADLPKLAINTVLTAAAGGAIALAGVPVTLGAGIVLAISITIGIGIEFVDEKVGFTDKLSEAAETMWNNLKIWWNSSSKNQNPSTTDPLHGLVCGPKQNIAQIRGATVYTV